MVFGCVVLFVVWVVVVVDVVVVVWVDVVNVVVAEVIVEGSWTFPRKITLAMIVSPLLNPNRIW